MSLVNELIVNRRIVWDRQPRPQRIGLVLGGGAARGIAHIGALQVLEEQGIYPQIVTGTSVGALVGGLYAAGLSATRLVNLLPEIRWLELASFKLPSVNLNDLARSVPMGLFDLDKMIGWIDHILGKGLRFDQLNLPFAAVATDLVTAEIVVMNDGPVAPAIRASCSVPGVFTPYRRDGRLLVDGVVVNNLPVSVAREMGADYVIAVDLLPLSEHETNARPAEPRNMMELAMTALFMLARATQIEQQLADVVVVPDISHIHLADLYAADTLLQAGRAAMLAQLPQIMADLQQRE
ncbi:MAG: patatin-like phospholipase family protein [Caldilineaceae bacterium]|nr:patatin-like phospholipase family protein [Caldilineaceae bacterium]